MAVLREIFTSFVEQKYSGSVDLHLISSSLRWWNLGLCFLHQEESGDVNKL